MTTTSLHGIPWTDLPHHPVSRASAVLGVSNSQVYKLLGKGRLRAVKSAGKTQITTESMVELQSDAKAWTPDASRVARANEIRLKTTNKAAFK
jgi:excisionase family DNA binding protein